MAAKSNELKITRIYDAPVKLVWDAWTDPKQVAQWWGPRGFTITTHSKDLRPGGHWSYTMHGPDGTDWENKTIYLEVEKYARLVYDHGGNDEQNRPALFRVTVEFKETKGKTKMDMTMTLPTPEAAEETRKFVKKAGGNSTWDRLAEYLDKETQGKEKFVINRSFKAPIDVMYDMWANPKEFGQWLAPKGFSMKVLKGQAKVGDGIFYSMGNDSMEMYGHIKYLEMVKPHLLSYQQQFADKEGNVSRHPGAPTWPETMQTKVTFNEEEDGQTRVTVEWEPIGNVTAEELQAFIKERGGMTQGWTGSFDKLEDYLATRS